MVLNPLKLIQQTSSKATRASAKHIKMMKMLLSIGDYAQGMRGANASIRVLSITWGAFKEQRLLLAEHQSGSFQISGNCLCQDELRSWQAGPRSGIPEGHLHAAQRHKTPDACRCCIPPPLPCLLCCVPTLARNARLGAKVRLRPHPESRTLHCVSEIIFPPPQRTSQSLFADEHLRSEVLPASIALPRRNTRTVSMPSSLTSPTANSGTLHSSPDISIALCKDSMSTEIICCSEVLSSRYNIHLGKNRMESSPGV